MRALAPKPSGRNRKSRFKRLTPRQAVTSFRLPLSLTTQLEDSARKKGISKSVVVREILEKHFSAEKGEQAGSFLQRAGKYVGCVEGPGDLSFNKKHLEDYGR